MFEFLNVFFEVAVGCCGAFLGVAGHSLAVGFGFSSGVYLAWRWVFPNGELVVVQSKSDGERRPNEQETRYTTTYRFKRS